MVEEDADWGKVLCEMGEVIPPFDPFVSYCSHCGLADEICSSKMMKENEERAKSEFAAGNECYNNQDYFHALKHFHTAYTCSPDFEEKEKITLKKVNCLVKLVSSISSLFNIFFKRNVLMKQLQNITKLEIVTQNFQN